MKKIIIGMLLLAILVTNSGCLATLNCVNKYDARVDAKILQMKIDRADSGNTEATVAIDVLQAARFGKGYWAAWKNDTGAMTAAHGIDAIWMALLAWGAKEGYNSLTDDDKDKTDGKVNVTIENGDDNTVNIVYGDGNDSNNDDNIKVDGDSNLDTE